MDRETIFRATLDKYLEPVEQYRRDPSVNEIMINGPYEVYVERRGKIELTKASFEDPESLASIARNLAQYTNKRITETTARFDSRLPDGSRIHVVMPRCSRNGLCISIRKFSKSGFSVEGLVESGSITPEVKEYLEIVVELERNLIVSGGTGSGKTSFLNALSLKIPASERIIVIEDTSELQLKQPHVLNFETAGPDRYGNGAVTIRDLFHSALRMRPDRIVIGECRGGEALDLIQAMTSGHGGSMSTLHANSGADALNRLETMALMSGIGIPLMALRSQVASAIDVLVQLMRLADGSRVVTEISEVAGLSSQDRYEINTVFEHVENRNKLENSYSGLQGTGNLSIFSEDVKRKGLLSKVAMTRRIFNAF
jgi:pilus assembly protein CpaF